MGLLPHKALSRIDRMAAFRDQCSGRRRTPSSPWRLSASRKPPPAFFRLRRHHAPCLVARRDALLYRPRRCDVGTKATPPNLFRRWDATRGSVVSRPRKKPAAPHPLAPPRSRRSSSLGDYIRRQRELANISLRKMAEQSGISAALLGEIESGIHNPSQTILQSIARGLRLSAETLYLQAGVLDPQDIEEASSVRELMRDPHLTERQRDVLVEIYAAFRAVNRTPRRD
jgi:transcriptional regulator with XRE-family HTH domain